MSNRTRARAAAFLALCGARLREFYREPEVIFWGFFFPVMLTAALAVAFRSRPAEPSRAVVQAGPGAASVEAALKRAALVKVETADEREAARALRVGKADIVVVPPAGPGQAVSFRFDPSRPEATVARARVDDALQRAAGRADLVSARDVTVSEPGGRYVDFLVPGLVGMNLMNAGLWGVGYVLVDMRIKKLMRRLLATPMRRPDFLAAQLVMREVFTVVEVSFLFGFAHLALGVPVRGSFAALLVVSIVGSLSFCGLGLLVASRARKLESVNGIMNLLLLPMLVGSGVFFSVERFPAAVQPALRALPLTALVDALRSIVLEGQDLATQWARVSLLAAWAVVSFLVGLRIFRWT